VTLVVENNEFQRKFFYDLLHDCYEYQDNHTDFLRFGTSTLGRIKRRLKDKILLLARRGGFVRRHFSIEGASERLMYVLANIDKLESFYHQLRDDDSKQLLIELFKFRILGAQHVKLPLNNEMHWVVRASIDRDFLQGRRTIRTGMWCLNRYKLQGLNGPLDIHAHPLGILNTFLLEQYSYKKGHRIIQVKLGDVVIDGGSCWGETALYFADKTGAHGKVYCFEFVQHNLEILQENLSLNQHLADRIEIVPKALWDKSGKRVSYCPRGPSTWLESNKKQDNPQVSTLSIDDFVKEKGIARVDYIKMDIEGSELRGLKGAEETIRTFRPRLAISIYHREDDFVTIPDYLDKLALRYEFFLDHFTIHSEETVLFASPMAD
jgi:FkbM family methyltransferase